MSDTVAAFEQTTRKTYEWLDELDDVLGWDDRQQAYAALRSTLQALRDRLPHVEVAQLAAQLPMLVRGFYFEGWDPNATPVKVRHRDEFLAPIASSLRRERSTPPDEVARAVFQVLRLHVTTGELEDVLRVLPPEIRKLFGEELVG
jgi:uncharacterized protein (DUF2267 family)